MIRGSDLQDRAGLGEPEPRRRRGRTDLVHRRRRCRPLRGPDAGQARHLGQGHPRQRQRARRQRLTLPPLRLPLMPQPIPSFGLQGLLRTA